MDARGLDAELAVTAGSAVARRPQAVPQVGHALEVHCVAWSSISGLVVSASADGTIRLWDGVAGRLLGVF